MGKWDLTHVSAVAPHPASDLGTFGYRHGTPRVSWGSLRRCPRPRLGRRHGLQGPVLGSARVRMATVWKGKDFTCQRIAGLTLLTALYYT
jgi:hypothetical protein